MQGGFHGCFCSLRVVRRVPRYPRLTHRASWRGGSVRSFGWEGNRRLLSEIVAGPDGNLWFTDYSFNRIGRITPTGAITAFPLPIHNSNPWGIAAGPHGTLWFTEQGLDEIGRLTSP